MYDPKSKVASEFICHEEIEETLAFAKSTNTTANIFKKLCKKQKLSKD